MTITIPRRTHLRRRLHSRADEPPTSLTIELGASIGVGPTSLAAFDAALRTLGVGDVNLIRLSSVIPPRATLVRGDRVRKPLGWGDRLYCVYAEQHATVPGETAAAGIGWAVRDDGSGAGLFVEHEAPTEEEVRYLIRTSLADMTGHRPCRFTAPAMQTVSTTCTGEPTVALVLAAFRAVSWASDGDVR